MSGFSTSTSGRGEDDWATLERLAQAAFEGAPVGMALTDLRDDGRRVILVANEALARFLGRSTAELVGMTFNELSHPDDLDADDAAAARIRSGASETYRTRKRYRHADGHYLWAELHARAVTPSDDSTTALAHVVDIGDTIRLEQAQTAIAQELEIEVQRQTAALASSERQLRAALQIEQDRRHRLSLFVDATGTTIGDWEFHDGIVEPSDDWYRQLGYGPDSTGSQPLSWQELVHPEDRTTVERLTSEPIVAGRQTVDGTFRVRRADGSWRWNRRRGRVTAVDDAGRPTRIIGIDIDITEQQLLEQQQIQAVKMQSLGAFAGGIAHDFNNIMAIVQGHAEALQRSADTDDDPADRIRRLGAIEQAVARAAGLVHELMTLSQPTTPHRAPIDLVGVITRTVSMLPDMFGEDIRVDVDIPDASAVVTIDESRFEAALLNLAANARDAMPTGGTFGVGVVISEADGAPRSLEIEVTDTGVGMDVVTLRSAFEPYFTTKAPGVGTGLGLATTYATIVEASGTISIDSRLGEGTVVHITLPVDVSGRSAVVDPIEPVTLPRSGTILVVEDEAELLELTADLLRSAGYRVHEALEATEALELLEQDDTIALLLTDAVMPGMSGPELATIVRRRWPSIGILLMTGYAATSSAFEPFEQAELLIKPVPHQTLLNAVARALTDG